MKKYLQFPFMEEEDGGAGGGAGGGGEPEGFVALLPEDMRENPALKDFKDVGGLAKSYLNTKSMVGNSIRIPGEDASDEDRQAFVNKLIESSPDLMLKPDFDNPEQSREFYRTAGMPEESAGYEFPEVEGFEYPEERSNLLREAAHKAGITKSQFKQVAEVIAAADTEILNAQAQATAQIDLDVREKWGNAYEQNTQKALTIAEKTGAPEAMINAIKNKQMPIAALEWLNQLSDSMKGAGMEVANQGDQGDPNLIAPEEAQAKIDEIMNNRSHPYWDRSHPQHKAAMQKMLKLTAQANPGMSTNMDDLRAGGMGSL